MCLPTRCYLFLISLMFEVSLNYIHVFVISHHLFIHIFSCLRLTNCKFVIALAFLMFRHDHHNRTEVWICQIAVSIIVSMGHKIPADCKRICNGRSLTGRHSVLVCLVTIKDIRDILFTTSWARSDRRIICGCIYILFIPKPETPL